MDPAVLVELVGRAAAGHNAAWADLIHLYGRRVFALAKSRLGQADVAEEITQSVFVTIASKLAQPGGDGLGGAAGYSEQGKFEAWLFRVAVNRIRDEVRKRRRHATPTDPEILAQGTFESRNNGHPSGVEPAEVAALRRAMSLLGEADREVIELRHHAGMSFAQMAQMLGEPLGTLLARHHRALRKLKSAMEGAPVPSDE